MTISMPAPRRLFRLFRLLRDSRIGPAGCGEACRHHGFA